MLGDAHVLAGRGRAPPGRAPACRPARTSRRRRPRSAANSSAQPIASAANRARGCGHVHCLTNKRSRLFQLQGVTGQAKPDFHANRRGKPSHSPLNNVNEARRPFRHETVRAISRSPKKTRERRQHATALPRVARPVCDEQRQTGLVTVPLHTGANIVRLSRSAVPPRPLAREQRREVALPRRAAPCS